MTILIAAVAKGRDGQEGVNMDDMKARVRRRRESVAGRSTAKRNEAQATERMRVVTYSRYGKPSAAETRRPEERRGGGEGGVVVVMLCVRERKLGQEGGRP